MKRPTAWPWLRAVGEVKTAEVNVAGYRIKVGGLKRVFRTVTATSRLSYLAYHWLNPNPPPHAVEALASLIKDAGLNHIARAELVRQFKDHCSGIAREHPRLRAWICRRNAVLDWLLVPPPEVDQTLRDTQSLLRLQLFKACVMLAHDPPQAAEFARRIEEDALETAAAAVQKTLCAGIEGADGRASLQSTQTIQNLSANLMLPVKDPNQAVAHLFLGAEQERARVNAIDANVLWDRLPREPTKCLLILSETREQACTRIGFWVPIAEGNNSCSIPGAPEAFVNGRGSAVFKDDLQGLRGFPETIDTRWQADVKNKVGRDLFVSLPLLVPHQTIQGPSTAIAVLNVNASCSDPTRWFRAYDERWLERARDAVAHCVEIAFYALKIRLAVNTGFGGFPPGSLFDLGSTDWNIFADLVGVRSLAPAALNTEEQAEAVDEKK